MKKWSRLSAMMKLTLSVSAVFLICAALIFLSGRVAFLDRFFVVLTVMTILTGGSMLLLWLTVLIVTVAGKCKKEPSPYRVFALLNCVILLGAVAYTIYDIKTDIGFAGGLKGVIVLICVVPVPVFLLLLEAIVYYVWKRRGD